MAARKRSRKSTSSSDTGSRRRARKRYRGRPHKRYRGRAHKLYRKPAYSAKTADRHELYEHAVQDPYTEVQRMARIFKRRTGRTALSLREDFGGTANLCAAWIRSHRDRTATAIDLDRETLEWGRWHNLAPLGEEAWRITLRCQDVRDDVPGRFDVACGFNYSYQYFKTRDEMRRYFESVRKTLKRDGILFLDVMGGWEARMDLFEVRNERRYTYLWEQVTFNPITNELLCKIHFRFQDGTEMRDAFTYDWRLWSLPELKELLFEAGFERADVYWEDEHENGADTGRFRIRTQVENQPGWNCYLVAQKRDPKRKKKGS